MMVRSTLVALVLFVSGFAAAQQSRLDTVLDRGRLICGVNAVNPGFGFLDEATGTYTGFDTDFCRAVAAALFDDPTRVEFVPLTGGVRFSAIQTGEVDVVFRNTTVTLTRDSETNVDFLPINFYDGQGVMVRRDLGVDSVHDLEGAVVCTNQGSTTEANWTDFVRNEGWQGNQLLTFEDLARTFTAFHSGRCDAITSDKSQLVGVRGSVDDPNVFVILPETLSKEPLAGFTFQNDSRWRGALSWIVQSLIAAEELGITSENYESFAEDPDNVAIRRFLGTDGALGAEFGLPVGFVARVVRHVGNYGEVYDRHLGEASAFHIPRAGSLNELHTRGGLLYAPPFR
jgi:general L-amino acid transport system substrate-binding protein